MVDFSTYSDRQLTDLLRLEDRAAFTEIFNRYNKLLYSHIYNKLRNAEESRDIVQEVFINLWEKRATVQDANLAGYLFTAARNRLLNLISHQKIVTDYTELLFKYQTQGQAATDHRVREKQLAAIIEAEIAALPPRMRQIFELSRREHLSNKEIALKLDLSEHTIADQIKKSLKVLRLRIGMVILIATLFNW